MVSFNRRTNTSDEKFLSGDTPYKGTLGPNRDTDTFDAFASRLRKENPRYDDFYSGSRTFNDVAAMSQAKIDQAASSPEPTFANPGDNSFAKDFLAKYSVGVQRGFVGEDEAVGPQTVARIASQPATAASNESSPETAGKFPGASGVNV